MSEPVLLSLIVWHALQTAYIDSFILWLRSDSSSRTPKRLSFVMLRLPTDSSI